MRVKKWRFLLTALMMLAAIACDPNKRKQAYLESGEKYLKQRQYQAAVIQFRNAIKIDPDLAEARYQIAQAYLHLGNLQGAYANLQVATRLNPNNADAQLQVATLLIDSGNDKASKDPEQQFAKAQEIGENVLAANPKNVQARDVLGAVYTAQRKWLNAIREYNKALDLDPQRVEDYYNLASVYISSSQPSQAEATYKRAIEAIPKSVGIRLALGQFYLAQGKMADAEATMEAANELDPHGLRSRLSLAPVYLAAGRMADAEKVYAEVKSLAPDDPMAYRALASFYQYTGQKEKAIDELRAISVAKPKDTTTKADLIDALLDLNRVQEATSLNQELMKAEPGFPQGMVLQGRIMMLQGRYPDAVAQFQKALKADPASAKAYYYLGVTQSMLDAPEQARAAWNHALELYPQMTDARMALAELELNTGNYNQALSQVYDEAKTNPNLLAAYVIGAGALIAKGDPQRGEKLLLGVLDHDPVSLPALSTLLNLYVAQGKTRLAVQRLEGLVRQYPQFGGLHYFLGMAYFHQGDWGKAEAAVRQAISLNPENPECYSLLGGIELKQGSTEKAKEDLGRAIKLSPRNMGNYIALAEVSEQEGNWGQAKKICEDARMIDPNSAILANELAYLYLDHGGDPNAALALAQLAKGKAPNALSIDDTLGWAYFKVGSTQFAIDKLRECTEKAPDNPLFQYHLGIAYMTDRQLDNAGGALQKALKNHPDPALATLIQQALERLSRL